MAQDMNQAHSDSIWTAKFSPCGKLLATGGKDSILKIWQVASDDSLDIIASKPLWELKEHASDIIDVSWHLSSKMLISCSFDQKVILWSLPGSDTNKKTEPQSFVFEHPDVPTQVSFFRGEFKNQFVSGALDGGLRVWNIDKEKRSACQKTTVISNPISALEFSPTGKWLVVGLINGMCILYEQASKEISEFARIDCKNRKGRFSTGRKICGITFIKENEFVCQTADSRLRIINVHDKI